MNRIFRLIFLAVLTAIGFNFLGVKSAEAMTQDEFTDLPVEQRVKVSAAKCGSDHICQDEEIKNLSVKRVGTTGSADEIAKLQAKHFKLNVEIRKVKGGETSPAGEELVDERERLNREIEVLRTPRVELADPIMFDLMTESEESSSEASNDPPFLVYFPGADTCNDSKACPVKGSACIEQVCFPGWGKAKAIGSVKGWIEGAKAIEASELNPTAIAKVDGGTPLCSLRPLQPGCSETCEDDEFPAVLGTADAFPTDMQRLVDLIRVANSCPKTDDGMTCQNPEWGYLANTNTVNYGQVRCLKRSSLPEPVVNQVNRAVGQAVAALPPPPANTAQENTNQNAKCTDCDMFLTVGGYGAFHTGLRDTFYNNVVGGLALSPTWHIGNFSMRGILGGGYGGRDQFSTLYDLTSGLLFGYRASDSFEWGAGPVYSGLYGYHPKARGTYLEQWDLTGQVYLSFPVSWLELTPFAGIGYMSNQYVPDHNVGFRLGAMIGVPIGRGK